MQFKDEVIFKLMLKKKEYEDKIKTELDQTVHVEINEWAKLNTILIYIYIYTNILNFLFLNK